MANQPGAFFVLFALLLIQPAFVQVDGSGLTGDAAGIPLTVYRQLPAGHLDYIAKMKAMPRPEKTFSDTDLSN